MLPCKCTGFNFSQYFWYFPKWCDTGTRNGSIFTSYTRLYTQINGPSLLYWQPNITTKNSVASYENYYSQMKACVHILIGKFVPVLKHVTFWYYGPPMIQYWPWEHASCTYILEVLSVKNVIFRLMIWLLGILKFFIQLPCNLDVRARQWLFSHASVINKWLKTKPTFWGSVENGCQLQKLTNIIHTLYILKTTTGTDNRDVEFSFKTLRYSFNAYA